MRKFIIFIVILLIFLVGGVILLPKLIPLEKIKPEIQAQVKKQIGRDLLIDGPIKISIWPNLSVNLQKVSLSNTSWGRAETFIALDEVDAELKLMPLLKKRIEIDRFVLHKPRIYLEVDKTGKGNWEFSNAVNTSKVTAPEKTTASAAVSTPKDLKIKFGKFQILDGVVNYEDHTQNTKYALDKIDIIIDAKDMDSPINIKGEAQYRARMLQLNITVDKLASLVFMSPLQGDISLNIKPFAQISLTGQFLEKVDKYMTVKMKTKVSDIGGLMNWVSPTGAGDIPFKTLELSSPSISLGRKKSVGLFAKISKMQMALDNMEMSGLLTLLIKDSGVPNINAELKLAKPLDIQALLNKLGTAEIDTEQTSSNANTAPPTKNGSEWSDEKIDLSVLHAVNAKILLKHQGLVYKDIQTGSGRAQVNLVGGKLNFTIPETSVGKGSITSKLSLNEKGAKTKINVNMQAKNMPIKPLLKTFVDIKMLSGAGEVNFSATATGQSQKSLIQSMAGKGNMKLSDGEIEGIDFVNVAQMLQKKLSNIGMGDGGTKFTDFSASFTMNKGIISNKDMHLVGPLVEANGAGDIDLPRQSMKYRVTPQIILNKQTIKDQVTGTSVTKTTGMSIPVDIKGPWSNLKIKPDYQAVLKNLVRNPKQFKAVGKTLEKNVRGQIKNLKGLKNIKKDPAQFLKDMENSQDVLKSLFGR